MWNVSGKLTCVQAGKAAERTSRWAGAGSWLFGLEWLQSGADDVLVQGVKEAVRLPLLVGGGDEGFV